MSYATDVAPDETADQATQRARKHVQRWVNHEIDAEIKRKEAANAKRKEQMAADEAALDDEIEAQARRKGARP